MADGSRSPWDSIAIRDRLVFLGVLVFVVVVFARFGLSGVQARGYLALLITALITLLWIAFAVLGTVGLYRWLRTR